MPPLRIAALLSLTSCLSVPAAPPEVEESDLESTDFATTEGDDTSLREGSLSFAPTFTNDVVGRDAESPGIRPEDMRFRSGRVHPDDQGVLDDGHYLWFHGLGDPTHGGQTNAEVRFFGPPGGEVIGLDNAFITSPDDPSHALYWRYQSANGIGLRMIGHSHVSIEAVTEHVNVSAPEGGFVQTAVGGVAKRQYGATGTLDGEGTLDLFVMSPPSGVLVHATATILRISPGAARDSFVRTCTAIGDASLHIARVESPYNAGDGSEVQWTGSGPELRLTVVGQPGLQYHYKALIETIEL